MDSTIVILNVAIIMDNVECGYQKLMIIWLILLLEEFEPFLAYNEITIR